MPTMLWKEDWPTCQQNLVRWWQHDGLALHLTVRRSHNRHAVSLPPGPQGNRNWAATPEGIQAWWTDAEYRSLKAEYEMAGLDYLAEAFPYFDTQIGPGSLGTFLGSQPHFDLETVWYYPCIDDPESYGDIHLDVHHNLWLEVHQHVIKKGLEQSQGRYLVGMPDLIENLDTLAALRGGRELLFDLVERPGWVLDRLAEINTVYFTIFDRFYELIKDEQGGNAFSAFNIWGPGKTAKLQCDFSAMISPDMLRKFALPFLEEQCRWLDYSLYHLDGVTALQHVDALLEMTSLNAIEWTPQAGLPQGGSSAWYDLYRRIKAGGKSVQAILVKPEEVVPLLDAVGPQGLFIHLERPLSPQEAETLLKAVEPYRV